MQIRDPYSEFTKVVSNSGLTVFMCPLDYATSVCMRLVVKVGGRDGKPGISHLLEHFLSVDTKLSYELQDTIDFIGGDLNLGTTYRMSTEYGGRVPMGKERVLLDCLSKLVHQPAWRADLLSREKEVVLNEISRRVGSVKRDQLHYKFMQEQYVASNQLYLIDFFSGCGNLGWPEDLAKITADDLIAHHKNTYRADNAALFVVGGFDPSQIASMLSDCSLLSSGPPENNVQTRAIPADILPMESLSSCAEYSTKELMQMNETVDYCRYCINVFLPANYNPIGRYLGNFAVRHFNSIVREERGQSYGADFYCNGYDDVSDFVFTAVTNNLTVDLSAEVGKALKKAADDQDRFERWRLGMMDHTSMSHESASDICTEAGNQWLKRGRIESANDLRSEHETLTFEQYRKQAREIINSSLLTRIRP